MKSLAFLLSHSSLPPTTLFLCMNPIVTAELAFSYHYLKKHFKFHYPGKPQYLFFSFSDCWKLSAKYGAVCCAAKSLVGNCHHLDAFRRVTCDMWGHKLAIQAMSWAFPTIYFWQSYIHKVLQLGVQKGAIPLGAQTELLVAKWQTMTIPVAEERANSPKRRLILNLDDTIQGTLSCLGFSLTSADILASGGW